MITVLGSTGFIGSHLLKKLDILKIPYYAPLRNSQLAGKHLGVVIYCIGLTADFHKRPFDTVEAHVCKLLEVLSNTNFDSILYLSSTRIYGLNKLAKEESEFHVNPQSLSDLYNISKLMGEALISAYGPIARVARLSNVYGGDINSGNFLSDIIWQAVQLKHVRLETSLESEKDFISINDVCELILKIASNGKQRIYNVASGFNVSNRQILEVLVRLTGCSVEIASDARTIKFPPINIEAINSEFGFYPSKLLIEMEDLVSLYQNRNGE